MERTTHIDQPVRKAKYIKPALTTHAPLRDITMTASPFVCPDGGSGIINKC